MVKTIRLSNGLRVVVDPMPFIRSVSMGIWTRSGSRDETPELNGISHFIEHMLFKGTENRSAKDIADEMDAIGGHLNAYTAREYTVYFTRVLDSHFDTALDIFADMFFNSKFSEPDIEKERNVIFEEINMYKDTPEDLAHDMLQSLVFSGDSLGLSILGSPESLSGFTRKTLADYYGRRYTPENTVISIAGRFDEDAVTGKLEKYFLAFKNPAAAFGEFSKSAFAPGVVSLEKDVEQLHMCLGFAGIETGSERSYDLAVLNTLFGGGMSSRLFQNIREDKGLVYSIYSFNTGYVKNGLLSVYAALNREQAEEALKLIAEEIDLLKREKISAKLLRDTKEQIKSNYLLGLESSSARMTNIGRSELLLNRVQTPEEISEKIEEVTEESVFSLANEIFDLKKAGLSVVGKLGGADYDALLKSL